MPNTLESEYKVKNEYKVNLVDNIKCLNKLNPSNFSCLSENLRYSLLIEFTRTGAQHTAHNLSYDDLKLRIEDRVSLFEQPDLELTMFVAQFNGCCLNCNKTYNIGTSKNPELRCREHLLLKDNPENEKCKEYDYISGVVN